MIKVTKKWAQAHGACPQAVRRFFERWPSGLTLNRRNLYIVADECPISWIGWLGGALIYQKGGDKETRAKWWAILQAARTPNGAHTRSPTKKQTFAKALADLLGL